MKSVSIGVLLLLLLTGCMSFNQSDITEVKNDKPEFKPVIGVKINNFNQCYDEEIDTRNVVGNQKMGFYFVSDLLDRWKEMEFIKDYYLLDNKAENKIKAYQSSVKYKNQTDYTLILDGYINSNSSLTLDIISPSTLFIVPAYTDVKFDLSFTLINNKTKESYGEKIIASSTTWQNLFFLPILPYYLYNTDNRIFKQAMLLYNHFVKKGAFKIADRK